MNDMEFSIIDEARIGEKYEGVYKKFSEGRSSIEYYGNSSTK